mgnify:CR=1 FL=1
MGKLGGHELNLSSDIDLMFTYAEDGETDGRRAISNQEFFIKVGQLLSVMANFLPAPFRDGLAGLQHEVVLAEAPDGA